MFETVKKREHFVRAYSGGKSTVTSGLILQQHANDMDKVRFGFTATRKLGGAVVRNRVKRRLRALVQRLLKDEKAQALFQNGSDYILVGRKATVNRPFDKLEKDLKYALHSLVVK